jgi:transcriptional accessory protein Tex/SPT6
MRQAAVIYAAKFAQISSKARDPEKDSVYAMYYDYHEPVSRILRIAFWPF